MTAALAGCLLLAACTGDGSPTPPPSTAVSGRATSPSPTPTTSVSAAPTLPAAAQAGTRAGAEAFFRYFWDVYNQSFSTLDTAIFEAISDPACHFCKASITNLKNAALSQRRFVGGRVQLGAFVAAPIDANGATVVNAVASQAEGKLVGSDGSTVRTFPVQNNARVDAEVRWENSRWVVVEVSIRSGTSSS